MPKLTIYRMKGTDELSSYLAPETDATLYEEQNTAGRPALLAVEVRPARLPSWAGWLKSAFDDAESSPELLT